MIADKKKYPAKKSGTCIVCEDLRVEVSGKYVLAGVYPGSSVQFHTEISEDDPGRISLMFVFWFGSCKGSFETGFSVIGPNEEIVFERNLGERVVESGQVFSLAVGIRNAQFTSTGMHRIVVSLDDRNFEFPLTIGTNPANLRASAVA